MNTTEHLCKLGQSIWLDKISRSLLRSATLDKYISNYHVTGLTSNPAIFAKALSEDELYDEAILGLAAPDKSGSDVFFELALEDLNWAAELFSPVHQASEGVDGWVSMDISPLLANDANALIREAKRLHDIAQLDNLLINIAGNSAGLIAIEELIFAGIPINVTLLFSSGQYMRAASAYMRGIERRIDAGLDPKVASLASLFVSRWDVAVRDQVAAELHNKLGVAIAQRTYRAWQACIDSPRWQRLAMAGAMPQRLLWASTGCKDKTLSDNYYVQELAAPSTINTMPEETLLAFGDHGLIGHTMSFDGDNANEEIALFEAAGIDIEHLAVQLQLEGSAAFIVSWNAILATIAQKRSTRAARNTELDNSSGQCAMAYRIDNA
ncbi:transaldolase [Oxalobacteraceae bacterium GrIS 2.11]